MQNDQIGLATPRSDRAPSERYIHQDPLREVFISFFFAILETGRWELGFSGIDVSLGGGGFQAAQGGLVIGFICAGLDKRTAPPTFFNIA